MIQLFEGVSFTSDLGNGITNEKMVRIRDKGQELYGVKTVLSVTDRDRSRDFSLHLSIDGFRMVLAPA